MIPFAKCKYKLKNYLKPLLLLVFIIFDQIEKIKSIKF
jgi:hypothetical protein